MDWGSYIISIAKTASKKIGTLISSTKFLSADVALYLCKSTIWPYMEYCCHVWDGAPSCGSSLEPLAHCRNVSSLSYLWRCYFGRCSSDWLNCFHVLIFEGGLFTILIVCMIFLSSFLDVTRMFMSAVPFLVQLDYRVLSFDL